jgi:hypothetical protein
MNNFFGLSRRTFTHDEIAQIAAGVAAGLTKAIGGHSDAS